MAGFRVQFADGHTMWLVSADARSMKPKDLRASYRKARDRAKTRYARRNPGAKVKVVDVRCIG